jgi:hypothetical protein
MSDQPNLDRITSGGGSVVLGDVRLEDGSFIGRDQINRYYTRYVTQVYHITGGAVRTGATVPDPFVGPRPFRAADSALFTGRDSERARLGKHLADPDHQTIVVYGPPDVGKTSFLNVAALPELAHAADQGKGITSIPLRDYRHAAPVLRALLHGRAVRLNARVTPDASAPDLVRALDRVSSPPLVLILDQFERFFLPDVTEPERDALETDLCAMLDAVPSDRLRVLIAIRDDCQAALDRRWGDLLPGLRESPVHLAPLRVPLQAEPAVMHPVRVLGVQPAFEEGFVEDQFLGDLDRLFDPRPGAVLPADLQLVCRDLYAEARAMGEQTIGSRVYRAVSRGRGAEGMVDQHFSRVWARIAGGQRETAQVVVQAMLARGWQVWSTPEQLRVEGGKPDDVSGALDELSRVGLLVWHVAGAKTRAYAFASYTTYRALERRLGRPAQKALQAREELKYAWQDWHSEERLAGPYQLNVLGQVYAVPPSTQPDVPETGFARPREQLLLLRSAVATAQPVAPWLPGVATPAARTVLRELEALSPDQVSGDAPDSVQSTAVWELGRLLGLDAADLPNSSVKALHGAVSWAAVAHPDGVSRETAALALMQAHPLDVLSRLRSACDEIAETVQRRRMAELHGILADAGHTPPDPADWGGGGDRIRTWIWRFRRRFSRDWPAFWRLAVGGGVGAGLALATVRGVLALLLRTRQAGRYFYSSFPIGFLLSGALVLGVCVLNALWLRPFKLNDSPQRPWLATGLGAVGFASMYVALLALFSPWTLLEAFLIPPMALLAGVGFAANVVALGFAPVRRRKYAVFLIGATLALALAQAVFVGSEIRLGSSHLGATFMFGWDGAFYKSLVPEALYRWKLPIPAGIADVGTPLWAHIATVVDAAVVGGVWAYGLVRGVRVAVAAFKDDN